MGRSIKAKIVAASVAVLLASSCGNANARDAQNTAKGHEGVSVMTVDSLTLTAIRDDDGSKRMPNKLFYGEADSAKVERLSPGGSVASSVSCFLVETQGKLVLFDTGNGAERGGRLLDRLASVGVAPGDIDILVLTHFHGDHIGGMMKSGQPVFTRAEVYVPEAECQAWLAMSNKNAKMVMDAMAAYGDRVHRFVYSEALPLGITPMAAPGHTPGHTVYRMGRLLIAGDLMHGFDLQIQDLDICPDYDMNPRQAAETRKKYVEYARQNRLFVAGMHFPGNGVKDKL